MEPNKALVCGSLAYDSILLFPDRFKTHIFPDKIHMLSVSFLVPEMRREFGGCAANIAYNLRLLGEIGLPMGTVGKDFAPYREWLMQCGVPTDYLKVIDSEFTAQAFITTDLDDNQITAFHPGAMQHSHLNQVTASIGATIGVLSPDGRQGMIDHAQQFAASKMPFIFDPGQGLPMFDAAELKTFIGRATWVAVNEYEWQMLHEKTGWSEQDITARVEALIVTYGGDGSVIYTREARYEIPCARPRELVDPTGCGDAYRAGVVHGLLQKCDWPTIGRLGSLMGAIKIESRGPQNHRFARPEFERRYVENFGQGSHGT